MDGVTAKGRMLEAAQASTVPGARYNIESLDYRIKPCILCPGTQLLAV
jgi:hypothetical protein